MKRDAVLISYDYYRYLRQHIRRSLVTSELTKKELEQLRKTVMSEQHDYLNAECGPDHEP